MGTVCNSHQVLQSKVIDRCSIVSLIQRLNKAVNDQRREKRETARLVEETASLAYSTSKQHQHVIIHEQSGGSGDMLIAFHMAPLQNSLAQERNSQKRNSSFDIFSSISSPHLKKYGLGCVEHICTFRMMFIMKCLAVNMHVNM